MKDKALQIIKHYGLLHQLKHFQSEVFELNEAIFDYYHEENKYYPEIEQQLKNHIAEEIADVQVMLDQFKAYYKINREDIREIMKYKIGRQLERIKNENIKQ